MIALCRFDDDSSQVRVARFGDASAPGPLAAGMFAGRGAAVTHQLPSTVEAGESISLTIRSFTLSTDPGLVYSLALVVIS